MIAAGLVLFLATVSAASVPVNVGVNTNQASILFYIAQEKGFFKAEGLEVTFVSIPPAPSEALPALTSGALDVAHILYLPSLDAAAQESGLKIVAGCDRSVRGQPQMGYYLIRKGLAGKVKGFGDLKGQRVSGMLFVGSQAYLEFARGLRASGLDLKDVAFVQAPPRLAAAALASKEIDVGRFLEPAASRLVADGLADVFAGTDIAASTRQNSVVYYAGRFMRERPEAAKGFMTAYVRASREFYRLPAAELKAISQKYIGLPGSDAALRAFHPAPDGGVDSSSLRELRDFCVKEGLLPARTPEAEIIDRSYLEHARKRLDGR